MSIALALTIAALGLHIVALAIWIGLRKRVEAWVYWAVLVGFTVMFLHRIAEFGMYEPFPFFGHGTALMIAMAALSGVFQTRRHLKRQQAATAALNALHDKLETLAREVEQREPIATKIAEIITDLRSQIRFYEEQAKEYHLPLFRND